MNYILALVFLYTACEKRSYIMGSGNRLQRGAHDQKKIGSHKMRSNDSSYACSETAPLWLQGARRLQEERTRSRNSHRHNTRGR